MNVYNDYVWLIYKKELQLTSDKNRAIVDKVLTKGVRGYQDFKRCLKKTEQTHLADRLIEVENQEKQGKSCFIYHHYYTDCSITSYSCITMILNKKMFTLIGRCHVQDP